MTDMLFQDKPVFCFTSDSDWYSDDCMLNLKQIFRQYATKLTVFATHKLPFDEDQDTQIGLHPNFLPGSTHGNDVTEVFTHLRSIYPKAQTFRSHSYCDSQRITEEAAKLDFRYDANLCLYLQQNIQPLKNCHGIIRFPSFFDDNIHWFHNGTWDFELYKKQFLTPGLKIINFHAFHLALNSPDFAYYQQHKSHLNQINKETIARLRFAGAGPETFLKQILDEVAGKYDCLTLNELYHFTQDSLKPKVEEISGRPAMTKTYQAASTEERKILVKNQYNSMDASNIYITSRDFHLRELEIDAIRKHIKQGQILDCGCGNGYTLTSLAKHVSNSTMTGLDFSENMIDGAKLIAAKQATELKSSIAFEVADITKFVPACKTAYDSIITERLIINLPDLDTQKAIILGLMKLLKPNGRLIIVEASRDGFDKLNAVRSKSGLPIIPDTYEGNDSSLKISSQWLSELVAAETGFDIINTTNFSFYSLVSKVIHPLHVAPDNPKFSGPMNQWARTVQTALNQIDFRMDDIGSQKMWVIERQ